MLKSLQAGRALAALSVVAFHLSLTMGVPRYGGDAVFEQYTAGGHLGVDFFFVLSGFVIVLAHAQDVGRPAQWGRYVYRRFVRLFPMYWIVTGIFALLVAFGLGAAGESSAGIADILSFTTLVKLTAAHAPLGVAWSLFHEVAFYAVFSLMILNKRLGIGLFALWVSVCLVCFNFTSDTPLQVYTSAFNLYFPVGIAAYYLYRKPGSGVLFGVAGVATVAFAVASLPSDQSAFRVVFVGGLALLLIAVAKLERQGTVRVPAALVFLGDASYSIYLTHLAFSGVLLKLLLRSGAPSSIGREGVYLCVLAATVLLACLAYVLVERPLLNLLRTRHAVRAATPTVVA
jgi:exopolysaccharide production protein ExoZ